MKTRRFLSADIGRLLVGAATMCLVGCVVLPLVELRNNTTEEIGVQVGSETFRIAPGNHRTFDYPSGAWGKVQVCLDRRLLQYRLRIPPNAFVHGVGFLFLRSRVRAQLNGDGHVWLLPRGDSFPVSESAEQPHGFPLVPPVVGTCAVTGGRTVLGFQAPGEP